MPSYLSNSFFHFLLNSVQYCSKLKNIRSLIINIIKKLNTPKKISITKSLIHGDLTYRNILVHNQKINFCDFARSDITFPEFDIYLFEIDKITHSSKCRSYIEFFKNIIRFIDGTIQIATLQKFYSFNNRFKTNKKIEQELKFLFLYRMLVLSLQNFKVKDPLPSKLLNYIEKRLINYYEDSQNICLLNN